MSQPANLVNISLDFGVSAKKCLITKNKKLLPNFCATLYLETDTKRSRLTQTVSSGSLYALNLNWLKA
jgi:hypothetical protein